MRQQYEFINVNKTSNLNAYVAGVVFTHPHWHKEFEIMYINKGCVTLVVNEKNYILNENDFFVINCNDIHSIIDTSEDNQIYFLHVNNNILPNNNVLDSEKIYLKSKSLEIKAVSEVFKQIFKEVHNKQDSYEIIGNALAVQMFVLLQRDFQKDVNCSENLDTSENQERMRRIFEYVSEHFNEDININSLAEQEFVSNYYLTHLFKHYTGITFTQYLNDLRIEKSINMLKDNSLTITDIYLNCGYSSYKSFNNAFKKITNLTPSEYRNSNKVNNNNKNGEEIIEDLHYDSNVGEYINVFQSDKNFLENLSFYKIKSSHSKENHKGDIDYMNVSVDCSKTTAVLNPIWKKLTTAGRAHEGLRDSWKNQLSMVQNEIGFDYIRFHCLLCDEMAVALSGPNDSIRYNFTYIDDLFDFLLSVNIRPFVEISFMPTALAAGEKTIFWWKGNISMPKVMEEWEKLIDALMEHLIERYTMEEVEKWYFEVWNEPNLQGFFFDGNFDDYMELYEKTVAVIKSKSKNFKVGGPATSNFKNGEAPWVKNFLQTCFEKKLDLDFISTHPYPNNFPLDGFGSYLECYRHECALKEDLTWLKETVENSKFPEAEIHITEWNNSPNPQDYIHDTAFMAPFLIKNNLMSTELTDSLGYWVFTDIFEEKSPGEHMFHGGFGLINKLGLPKAAYWGYWFLNKLGNEIIEQTDDYIITKSKKGYQILVYNYSHYTEEFASGNRDSLQYYDRYGSFKEKDDISYSFKLNGLKNNKCLITKSVLDRNHGSSYDAWLENGCLEYPTKEELQILMEKSKPVTQMILKDIDEDCELDITVPAHGVAMFDIVIKK